MPRRYQLKRRAERRDETRERIVDATIHLHQTVGSAGASITAIAREAGVSRLTVYRHFPDEVSLLEACTSKYNVANPPPDAPDLLAIGEPERRLEVALQRLYAYYAENQAMLLSGVDALPTHPALGVALRPYFEGMRQLVDLLASGWERDGAPGTALHGAVGHAVSLGTWRSLRHEQGLTNEQAVRVMVGMVRAAKDITWFE